MYNHWKIENIHLLYNIKYSYISKKGYFIFIFIMNLRLWSSLLFYWWNNSTYCCWLWNKFYCPKLNLLIKRWLLGRLGLKQDIIFIFVLTTYVIINSFINKITLTIWWRSDININIHDNVITSFSSSIYWYEIDLFLFCCI